MSLISSILFLRTLKSLVITGTCFEYGMKEEDIKAGHFQFEYSDILGVIKNYSYNLSPEYEGLMVFFPAGLRHCVYPFYEIDEPRISIAGNLSYLPCWY